jgi:hypothetical protein
VIEGLRGKAAWDSFTENTLRIGRLVSTFVIKISIYETVRAFIVIRG